MYMGFVELIGFIAAVTTIIDFVIRVFKRIQHKRTCSDRCADTGTDVNTQ